MQCQRAGAITDSDSLYKEWKQNKLERGYSGKHRLPSIANFSKYQQRSFNCETKYMILKDFECFANRIRTFLWGNCENFQNQKCNMTNKALGIRLKINVRKLQVLLAWIQFIYLTSKSLHLQSLHWYDWEISDFVMPSLFVTSKPIFWTQSQQQARSYNK